MSSAPIFGLEGGGVETDTVTEVFLFLFVRGAILIHGDNYW
jgi:hypothetical protein